MFQKKKKDDIDTNSHEKIVSIRSYPKLTVTIVENIWVAIYCLEYTVWGLAYDLTYCFIVYDLSN